MKNLHITDTEKFVEPFIQFINKSFDKNEHTFCCIITSAENHMIKKHANVFTNDKIFMNFMLVKSLYQADKIFLHGLFNVKVILMLFIQPWLLKKCYWIVWGADLYAYRKLHLTFKAKFSEFLRAFVIKRLGGLITHIKGDYLLAKKWYGVRGKYYYSFMYPSNLYKEISIAMKSNDDSVTYIQVGNSADPSNNHFEVFEKLKSLNIKKIKVISPLSYGNREYAEKVVKRGKEIFGGDFQPLLEFMPNEKYLEILSKMDVAVFNHNRQQAVGNITSLLSLRKKVYIRDDITTWDFCKEHSLKVYSANNQLSSILEKMEENIKDSNHEKMREQFSEQNLIFYWKKIFEGE